MRHLHRYVIIACLVIFCANGLLAQGLDSLGGPYTADANTVLLLHFDGNLTNSAAASGKTATTAVAHTTNPAIPVHFPNRGNGGDWTAVLVIDRYECINGQPLPCPPERKEWKAILHVDLYDQYGDLVRPNADILYTWWYYVLGRWAVYHYGSGDNGTTIDGNCDRDGNPPQTFPMYVLVRYFEMPGGYRQTEQMVIGTHCYGD